MKAKGHFICLYQKKDHSWILSIDTTFVKQIKIQKIPQMTKKIISFFNWLDYLAKFPLLLILIGSIGLGFGMGVIVFSRPTLSLADSNHPQALIIPRQIEWDQNTYQVEIDQDNTYSRATHLWFFSSSSGLESPSPIHLFSSQLENFAQVKIGDSMVIVGNNNGRYKYTVTQIALISRDHYQDFTTNLNQTLVLSQNSDLIGSQVQVVIATRVQ